MRCVWVLSSAHASACFAAYSRLAMARKVSTNSMPSQGRKPGPAPPLLTAAPQRSKPFVTAVEQVVQGVKPDTGLPLPPAIPPSAHRTSRLCVKGLPKYVDEARLREHFSAKGEVTDVKVLRARDGTSRQLAFIGFKSEVEAETAQKYFDRSFLDTGRMTVELAFKYGESSGARPWSKYSEGSSAHARQATAAEDGKGLAKGKKDDKVPAVVVAADDPKLAEFLALMQPRSKARIWSNDEPALAGAAAQAKGHAGGRGGAGKVTKQASSPRNRGIDSAGGGGSGDSGDEEEYQELAESARRAAALPGTGQSVEESSGEDASVGSASDDDSDADLPMAGEAATAVTPGATEAMSDLEYLRSRMAKWDDEDDGAVAGGPTGGTDAKAELALPMVVDGAEEAAARADQSGVGPSPRCSPVGSASAVKKVAKAAGWDGDGAAAATATCTAPVLDGDGEDAEPISETGRLFVRNLPYGAGEAELQPLFEPFGEVAELHLVRDRASGRSKGIAYVLYTNPDDAVAAKQQLDMGSFQGRLLHILPARRARTSLTAASGGGAEGAIAVDGGDGAATGTEHEGDGTDVAARPKSFKAERVALQKADAGNRTAWNTLFVRADTVAEAVAAHYGVSKAELLDPTATDVAVRMALGEAAVIAQTKQALAEQGVAVETLEVAAAAAGHAAAAGTGAIVARSRTTLLVKNLPYSCTLVRPVHPRPALPLLAHSNSATGPSTTKVQPQLSQSSWHITFRQPGLPANGPEEVYREAAGDVEEEELMSLFGRCGPVSRLVLPPSHALAIVEYVEPADARAAFKMLAYKKLQNVPLYLEWAPRDIFSGEAHPTKAPSATARTAAGKPSLPSKAHDVRAAAATAVAAALEGGEAEEGAGSSAGAVTLFVKNLHFDTTDIALKKHFEKVVAAAGGMLHSARVVRKKSGGAGSVGKGDSMGYGFVDCGSPPAARAALQRLQGSMLDGHRLLLQLSLRSGGTVAGAGVAAGSATRRAADAGPGGGGAGSAAAGSCRLLVRNVAFEATRSDVVGLFGPFGAIRSCRLPRKFDGTPRGFAFVDFATRQEAAAAMEGVTGTHLYGRRLKIEYAADQEDVDEEPQQAAGGDGYAPGVLQDARAAAKVAAARARAGADISGGKRKGGAVSGVAAPKRLRDL